MRPIGYYVHHHGAGHRARAVAVARAARGRVVLIGTGLAGRVDDLPHLDLPDDRLADAGFTGTDGTRHRPDALHYAPHDHPGIRARVAAITRWIAAETPALVVVDVSAEVAMLARLASVPTVVVRLGGVRTDPAHLDAFRGASALLAPFAAALDDPATPAAIAARTTYLPGLVARPPVVPVDPTRITVVLGAGGGIAGIDAWIAAALAVPDFDWHVIGPCVAAAAMPSNLTVHGWVDDAPARIAASAIVVGGAGDGVVATVLAARRPFVCLPEDRPYDEQRSKGRALARAGAAILCDDAAGADWRALVDAARGLDAAAAAALDDIDGPARAAAWLDALADRKEDTA